MNPAFSYAGTAPTITVKWDDSADFEVNLERIITQKWIANFPLGSKHGQNIAEQDILFLCQSLKITVEALFLLLVVHVVYLILNVKEQTHREL